MTKENLHGTVHHWLGLASVELAVLSVGLDEHGEHELHEEVQGFHLSIYLLHSFLILLILM